MTTDKNARKTMPIFRGVLKYFPDAIAAVAQTSYVANEQHNPGQEMFWNRGKSRDHADALIRHLLEAGKIDSDGLRHSAKVAWRALALLQEEIEAEEEYEAAVTAEAGPAQDYGAESEKSDEAALRAAEAKLDTLGLLDDRSDEKAQQAYANRLCGCNKPDTGTCCGDEQENHGVANDTPTVPAVPHIPDDGKFYVQAFLVKGVGATSRYYLTVNHDVFLVETKKLGDQNTVQIEPSQFTRAHLFQSGGFSPVAGGIPAWGYDRVVKWLEGRTQPAKTA